MSNKNWRTGKPIEQFSIGKSLIEKIKEYEKVWESRCYKTGIPDEVHKKIAASGRAPSYKSIAMCILKSDMNLTGLGFDTKKGRWFNHLKQKEIEDESKQQRLF